MPPKRASSRGRPSSSRFATLVRESEDRTEIGDGTGGGQEESLVLGVVMKMLEQQNKLIESLVKSSGPSGSNSTEDRPNDEAHRNMGPTLEQFKRLGPPVFRGTTDPMVAEDWLKQIKKIFAAIGCGDEQKVVFATFVMQGEADDWWEAKTRLLGGARDGRPISWEVFEEAFLERYFPQEVRDNKEAEFIKLVQGGKSVMEYEKEFTSLSRFASTIMANERSKCQKFLNGLRPVIKSRLAALRITVYTDLVERAVIV